MGIRRLGQIEVKWDQLEVQDTLVGIKGEERIMFNNVISFESSFKSVCDNKETGD